MSVSATTRPDGRGVQGPSSVKSLLRTETRIWDNEDEGSTARVDRDDPGRLRGGTP